MTKRKRTTSNDIYNDRDLKRGGRLVALSKRVQNAAKQQHNVDVNEEQKAAAHKAKQKEQHMNKAPARIPYHACERTLLIGEADCSFALALGAARQRHCVKPQQCSCNSDEDKYLQQPSSAETNPDGTGSSTFLRYDNIVATCYESEDELYARYSNAAAVNINKLHHFGSKIHFNVDATKLHQDTRFTVKMRIHDRSSENKTASSSSMSHTLSDRLQRVDAEITALHASIHDRQYERVLWLFPHLGSGEKDTAKNNNQHRELLAAFLSSLCLSRTVKCDTDGGEIHIVVKRGKPYDEWQVAKLPKMFELPDIRYKSARPFDPRSYPTYRHQKTSASHTTTVGENANNEFLASGCTCFVFQRIATREDRRDAKRAQDLESRLRECVERRASLEALRAAGMDDMHVQYDSDDSEGSLADKVNDDDGYTSSSSDIERT